MTRYLILFALLIGLAPNQAVGADLSWQGKYDQALSELRAGRFSTASAALTALSKSAPTPAQGERAKTLADLATAWHTGGYRLVAPRLQGTRRTTGELAGLYIDGVWFGLGTGAWLSIVADTDSAATTILPALSFAGLNAGIIAMADKRDMLKYGLPRSISAGLRIGLMEGIVWAIWYQAQARSNDELSAEGVSTLIWGMTTLGATTGLVLGNAVPTTPGRAAFTESGALWSAAVVGLTAAALSGDDSRANDAFMLSSAIALNIGAAGAAWLASEVNPSPARARFIDLGAIGGSVLAGGLFVAIAGNDTNARLATGITALGMAGGLATAWYLTADMATEPLQKSRPTAPRVSLGVLPLVDGAQLGVFGTF